MNQTYLFYDLETSGLNKCFDQILQFAAIKTDSEFNKIETYNFNVALRNDIVISPEALLVHRISPSSLKDGMCEYDAVRKIHDLMNTPNTISLGYNTLGFDDEFLRFSFYRNLLTPYTHQFKNNCFRMDIYPMAVFYYLFADSCIKWPYIEDQVSLKLENISKENNLATGPAHDALVDVEATVNLARIFLGDKNVWKYLSDFFVKNFDKKRCESIKEVFQSRLGRHSVGLFVDGKIGKNYGFIAPFLSLGNSIPYKNQYLWLRLDREELQNINEDNIEESCYVIRKKYGEPPFVLPPYERFLSKAGDEQKKIMSSNLDFLKKNPKVFEMIVNYFINYKYPEVPGIDTDAFLYERGFLSGRELSRVNDFHGADFNEKIKISASFDNINEKLAKRILFRNYDVSSYEELVREKNNYLNFINPDNEADLPLDYSGKKRISPDQALVKTREIMEMDETSSEDKALLNELKTYIEQNFKISGD